ncbi:BZ3501_MvSof-1269-A2-R1_Chr2-2g05036 [Microbotryum saponariae]|nr:BZ3501_MvSof-1269-A2-R1_Chr2-2g05036 [Microbotryum saponariae]
MGLSLLQERGRTTSKWMWARLACAIDYRRLYLLRWRAYQRLQKNDVVPPPPESPNALGV